jgi:hypothetical protein
MSKYPDRIWAYAGAFKMWRDKFPEHAKSTSPTEYIRADVSDALVAAAYEDARNTVITTPSNYAAPTARIEIANAIDRLAPTDARAALDRIRQEARDEALREAAQIVSRAGHSLDAEILALITKDADNG